MPQAHREDVVTDKEKLDKKINKLNNFIQGKEYTKLAGEEQDLMWAQLTCMTQLSQIMGKRIKKFH